MSRSNGGLHIESISKMFGSGLAATQALAEVSLRVEPGQIVALVGNNGAGKSTLMSICAGLLSTDLGTVTVAGDRVTDSGGTPTRRLGLAPQEEALYPTLTVTQNLAYFGRLAGLSGRKLSERVDSVATRLMIQDLLLSKASSLSGGQRRQLHTGLALMHDPQVLLLDEPTVGVDIDTRAGLLDFVRATADEGAAILYSTHQLHEVEALDARIVLIDHGRIQASGSPEELVADWAPQVAELVFDTEHPNLPTEYVSQIEDRFPPVEDEYRITIKLDGSSRHIGEIVDRLDDSAKASLLAASVVPPSLERAYLKITRDSRLSDVDLRDPVPLGGTSE